MSALYIYLQNLLKSDEGQDLIEYALIIGLMVVLAIVGLTAMGTSIAGVWTAIKTWLDGVAAGI